MEAEDRGVIILGVGALLVSAGVILVFELAKSALAIFIYTFTVMIVWGVIYNVWGTENQRDSELPNARESSWDSLASDDNNWSS